MHFNPFFCEMKVLFCKCEKFSCGFSQKTEGFEDKSDKKRQKTGHPLRRDAAERAQGEEITQAAQQHPQEHEEPQLPPAGDAAQKEEQHRGQQGIGEIQENTQLLQPGPAQTRRHQIIEEAQRRAAGQTQKGLQPLRTGVDPHQPMSLPRKPRRRSRSPAYSRPSIRPSTSSSPPSRVSLLIFRPLP